MNSQVFDKESAALQQRLQSAEFLFMSSHSGIRAQGVFEELQFPVLASSTSGSAVRKGALDSQGGDHARDQYEAFNLSEAFNQKVRDALNRAQAQGIANPIVIGAIPFDLTQPAYLSVPRTYQMFSRALEQPGFGDDSTPETSQVLRCQSLPEQARFQQSVKQAIANFQLSDIRKAVLSRLLELELDQPLNLDAFFSRLIQQNPSGYHFRIPLLDGRELIGASPELLVRREGVHIFSNPLAGSARRQADPEEDQRIKAGLQQSAKDAYEHSLVIEDIRARLEPLCMPLEVPESPSLLGTSAMWHLSTPISGKLRNLELSALQIACRLHPTPALCGFPTQSARKLIQLVEPFDRGVFGGMVGWCDAQGNGEWAVTIRCGLFEDKRIQLFAGAGIVEDSKPESEWLETQAKLQTMLNALQLQFPAEKKQREATPLAEVEV